MNVFVKYGSAFKVMAEFDNTEEGVKQANQFMLENDGAALLYAEGDKLIIAHKNDKGVPVSAEVLL